LLEEMVMKQLCLLVLLVLVAIPAWSEKKMNVADLENTLAAMHKAGKSDADVADALKPVTLTEELTGAEIKSVSADVPGPLTTEQLLVLEARSATLTPPAADLPATPAPDAATQKTILDAASDYVTKTYEQLPALTATKTTMRFQDNVEAPAPPPGTHGSLKVGANGVSPFQVIHYVNSADATASSEHGADSFDAAKDKTLWGANRMIGIEAPDPNLGAIFAEAQAGGNLKWLRWETLYGQKAAVYGFEVPKKKSHFALNVCCFPGADQNGVTAFQQAATAAARGGGGMGGGTGGTDTAIDWHAYKSVVPYRGEFFIDPATGTVLRLVTSAELKFSDVVRQDDTRIDYAAVPVDGKTPVLPARVIVSTIDVPSGDTTGAGESLVRRTLLTSEYKGYQAAGAK